MKTTRLDDLSIPVDLYICGQPEALLIQPLERKEMATIGHEVSLITRHTGRPFAMAAFKIEDWHLQLTPWHDDAISRREEVGKHAAETLRFITDELLPRVNSLLGDLYAAADDMPAVLGGYSLAGLFSLWASTLSNAFQGIAATSPSVWIRDLQAYARSHPTQSQVVYMSLGRKEEHVRNVSMSRVGANIRFEQQLLEQQLGPDNTTLQWNEGGHFDHMDTRTAQAYAWTLNKLHALRKSERPRRLTR